MSYKFLYFFTFFILIIYGNVIAQLAIQLSPNPQFSNVQSNWQATFNWNGNDKPQVFGLGTIQTQEGEILQQWKTAPFQLQRGRQEIQGNKLPLVQQDGMTNLHPGNYSFCLVVIDQGNQIELGRVCQSVQVQEGSTTLPLEKQKGLLGLQSSGYARLSMQHAHLADSSLSGYYGPQSFARMEAAPKFVALGIPLEARLFLSTEEKGLRYDLNTISLNFDQEAWLQMAREKAQQLLWEQLKDSNSLAAQNLAFLREQRYQEAMQKLGPYTKMLEDSSMLAQLKELEELDHIESILDHPLMQETGAKWEELTDKYGIDDPERLASFKDSLRIHDPEAYRELVPIFARGPEWQRLQEKHQRLQQLQQKLAPLQQAKKQHQAAEAIRTGDWRQFVQSPEDLQALGVLDKKESLLTSVKRLGFGNIFPRSSPLLMEGISLKGVDVAVNPSSWYFSFTAGKIQQPAFLSDSLPVGYSGKLVSGQMGLGKEEGNHLFGSFLLAAEKENAQLPDSLQPAWPARKNAVFGLEGQFLLWQDALRLKGEVYQSILQAQIDNSGDTLFNGQPEAKGVAMAIEGELKIGKTLLAGRMLRLEPGYYSLGAPFLLTDRLRYEGRINHSFEKLQVGAFVRRDRDNLLPRLWTRTSVTSAGVQLTWRPKKAPYLQVNLMPYYQQNDRQDSLAFRQLTSALTATSGYSYELGDWRASSTLTYAQQLGRGKSIFDSHLLTATQGLYKQGGSLQATFTRLSAQYTSGHNRTMGIDLSGSLSLFKRWTNSVGLAYLEEQAETQRYSFYWQGSLPIWKQLNLQTQARYDRYAPYNQELNRFSEYLFLATLSYQW